MAEAIAVEHKLVLQSASFTDTGGRKNNQDALDSIQNGSLSCHVVADGAGGHAEGELAAGLVIESVAEAFLASPGFSPLHLAGWISQATRRVGQQQALLEKGAAMSATVAALLVDMQSRQALWGHLGDTRIYFFRKNRLLALTKDHSVVQQFIDAGYCTPEQGRLHPQRHVLYAAIGAEGDALATITQSPVQLVDGDAFLICSDGFWEWIEGSEMEQALSRAADVHDWLEAMKTIADARARQSDSVRDNTTAIALWVAAQGGDAVHHAK